MIITLTFFFLIGIYKEYGLLAFLPIHMCIWFTWGVFFFGSDTIRMFRAFPIVIVMSQEQKNEEERKKRIKRSKQKSKIMKFLRRKIKRIIKFLKRHRNKILNLLEILFHFLSVLMNIIVKIHILIFMISIFV